MSSRSSRRRIASVTAAVLMSVLLGQSAAHAGGVAEGDCRLGDTQFLEGEPGSPQSISQVCGGNSAWSSEASWYWTDEKLVIVEPNVDEFDYSFFSDLNPFTGEGYSFRKANELFPDTSSRENALAKLQYAMSSMSAKPRAIESRGNVSTEDLCVTIPQRESDADIARGDGWLPPAPTADGSVGTYTYTLSSTLTPEQRAVVLAGLATFEAARSGSDQPRLVEWLSGSEKPPTITFQNPPDGIDDDHNAEAQPVTLDRGRDGLARWVNGDVNLTSDADDLAEWVIVHEILHVYGFRHSPEPAMGEVMSPTATTGVLTNIWDLTNETAPKVHGRVDSCTKAGIQAAAAPR